MGTNLGCQRIQGWERYGKGATDVNRAAPRRLRSLKARAERRAHMMNARGEGRTRRAFNHRPESARKRCFEWNIVRRFPVSLTVLIAIGFGLCTDVFRGCDMLVGGSAGERIVAVVHLSTPETFCDRSRIPGNDDADNRGRQKSNTRCHPVAHGGILAGKAENAKFRFVQEWPGRRDRRQ